MKSILLMLSEADDRDNPELANNQVGYAADAWSTLLLKAAASLVAAAYIGGQQWECDPEQFWTEAESLMVKLIGRRHDRLARAYRETARQLCHNRFLLTATFVIVSAKELCRSSPNDQTPCSRRWRALWRPVASLEP